MGRSNPAAVRAAGSPHPANATRAGQSHPAPTRPALPRPAPADSGPLAVVIPFPVVGLSLPAGPAHPRRVETAPRRPRQRSAAPDWRLTRRGRRVLAAMVLLTVVGVALVGASAARGGGVPSASPSRTETVTVRPGESLWQIAREVAPTVDARVMVDRIAELNGLHDASLAPGQTLVVPTR